MLNKQGLRKDNEGNIITITEARIRGGYKGAKYGALWPLGCPWIVRSRGQA